MLPSLGRCRRPSRREVRGAPGRSCPRRRSPDRGTAASTTVPTNDGSTPKGGTPMRAPLSTRMLSALTGVIAVALALTALLVDEPSSTSARASGGRPFADHTVLVGFEPTATAGEKRSIV